MSPESSDSSHQFYSAHRGAAAAAAALSLASVINISAQTISDLPLQHAPSREYSPESPVHPDIQATVTIKNLTPSVHKMPTHAARQLLKTTATNSEKSVSFSSDPTRHPHKTVNSHVNDEHLLPKLPTAIVTGEPTPSTNHASDTATATITPELTNLHSETLSVPADVEAIMRRDTVYLPAAGCSGFLVRQDDKPIGIMTAEHCSLRGNGSAPYYHKRYIGTDNREYAIFPDGLQAATGESIRSLETVGTVHELLVPNDMDSHLDLAIGALEGHTAQEVLNVYNASKLSLTETRALTKNDVVYMSGWPASQLNRNGSIGRQSFAGRYVGEDTQTTTIGEELKLHLVAVPVDQDGAVCSFGASGSQGFINKSNEAKSIGTLATFIDLTGNYYGNNGTALKNKTYFETKLGVNLDGIGALCGFAYETPDSNNSPTSVNLVESLSDIPGQNPEAKKAKALQEFFDSSVKKTIIDGDYGFSTDTGKDGTFQWVNRPVIFYDPISDAAVLGWYDETATPGNLHLEYIDDIKYLTFYRHPGTTADVKLISSEGSIAVKTSSETDKTLGSNFVDATGTNLGQIQASGFFPSTESYILAPSESMGGNSLTIHKQYEYLKGGK